MILYGGAGEVASPACRHGILTFAPRTTRTPDRYSTRMKGIAPGDTARRSLTISEHHVAAFADLTGDYNPLHFDADFAASTRFGRLITQGGLTTGLLHAVVAMDLPGPGSVFLSQEWKFTAPVFVGDTICAEVTVLSVHDSKPVTQLAVRVTRQSGELVLEGEAWCYTATPAQDRPDDAPL